MPFARPRDLETIIPESCGFSLGDINSMRDASCSQSDPRTEAMSSSSAPMVIWIAGENAAPLRQRLGQEVDGAKGISLVLSTAFECLY